MSRWLEGLNPEQRDAVARTEGPLLVLAGAGTGKTKVITTRIAHLVGKRVAPKNILAMTFTNKAAAEMRERVGGLVGKTKAKDLTVGTFHAFCVQVLREFGPLIGLPKRFAICDSGDQLTAVRGAMRELHVGEAAIQPRYLLSVISLAKNRLETPAGFLEKAADDRDELIGRVWQRYQEHLTRARSVDFDDLLLLTLRVLTEEAGALATLRQRYQYLHVDEYQDTNRPQFEIVQALAKEHRNLCAVGDDDQSIYGWRGADVRIILDFEKHFPEAKIVRLRTNYRSTQQIIDLAQRVIRNNPNRHDKDLRSARGDGPPVSAKTLDDEMQEAEWVVEQMVLAVQRREARWRDFAVLFRTGVQPRVFEENLRARAIPYVLVGGMSFFDRKEVRDVMAYLKLCANPDDEVSLLRIVNVPPRGVGKTTLDRVLAFATDHGIAAGPAFDRADEIDGVGDAGAAVQRLRQRLGELGKGIDGAGFVDGVRRLVEDVAYKSEIDRLYSDPRTRQLRWAGVLELFNQAENYAAKASKPTLAGFLERLTMQSSDSDTDADGKRDVVTLMTMHAAKGLEYPRVYLVGFEEGLLPHARSVEEDTVEEERRLVYVGITRAQRYLTITWAATRARAGQRSVSFPSRFYFELKGEPPPDDWRPAGAPDELAPAKTKRKAKRKTKRKAKKKSARRSSRS